MKPEQQRIKLAEWRGWTDCRIIGSSRWFGIPPGQINKGDNYRLIPDYPLDLNAVHELRGKLPMTRQEQCAKNLIQIVLETKEVGTPATLLGCFMVAAASAEQWCEAILRTLNLWED